MFPRAHSVNLRSLLLIQTGIFGPITVVRFGQIPTLSLSANHRFVFEPIIILLFGPVTVMDAVLVLANHSLAFSSCSSSSARPSEGSSLIC